MKLSEFKFDLPSSHIALYPTENRDESRLMVIHKDSGEIEHKVFKDVVDYFDEGDMMVINDTKVFPARLYGNKEKTGAKIEVFLLRELNKDMNLWDVLVDPARKIRVGNKLYFGDGELVAEVIDNTTSRGRTIRFLFDGTDDEFYAMIDRLGETPLPREIKRSAEPEDRERFQTIYANKLGAVAAPTAGLHFTKQVMKRLEIVGVDIFPITLHVGLGTFRPVDVEDLTKHKMDSENFEVIEATADRVNLSLDYIQEYMDSHPNINSLLVILSNSSNLKHDFGRGDLKISDDISIEFVKSFLRSYNKPERYYIYKVGRAIKPFSE